MTDLVLHGIDDMLVEDRPAIVTTLTALLTGFANRDTDLLSGVYADDADWVNAFGSVKNGNRQIVDYLRGLFHDHNFAEGSLAGSPYSSLRRVTDDVAVVSTHLQVTGQGPVGGDTIDVRDNHSVRVLHRHRDGAWRIESEMYMNVRPDQTYANHS